MLLFIHRRVYIRMPTMLHNVWYQSRHRTRTTIPVRFLHGFLNTGEGRNTAVPKTGDMNGLIDDFCLAPPGFVEIFFFSAGKSPRLDSVSTVRNSSRMDRCMEIKIEDCEGENLARRPCLRFSSNNFGVVKPSVTLLCEEKASSFISSGTCCVVFVS